MMQEEDIVFPFETQNKSRNLWKRTYQADELVKFVPYGSPGFINDVVEVVDSEDEAPTRGTARIDGPAQSDWQQLLPPQENTPRGADNTSREGPLSSSAMTSPATTYQSGQTTRLTERAIQSRQHRRQTVDEAHDALEEIETTLMCQRESDDLRPLKEGWVLKKSPRSVMGWQRRYLVLTSTRLSYFVDPAKNPIPRGRLDFELLAFGIECLWDPNDFSSVPVHWLGNENPARARSASLDVQVGRHEGGIGGSTQQSGILHTASLGGSKRGGLVGGLVTCCGTREYCCGGREEKTASKEVMFRVRPIGSKRAFEFKGPYLEVVEWVEALRPLALHCRDPSLSFTSIAVTRQSRFWKVDRISPTKFEDVADTGDVILFRTHKTVSKIQRLLTGGVYDHVALVLRKKNGSLQLLEAMGDTGVSLQSWSLFVERGWFLAYERVVIRRVHFRRHKSSLRALATFCKENVGKPYKLSVQKLFKQDTLNQEHDDFFCSELVANALKVLGVLNREAAASAQYWPSSFGQNSKTALPLEDGCTLDDELLVDFYLDPKIGAQLEILGVPKG